MRGVTFLMAGLLLMVVGCLGDGLADVSGTVTMDGQPLKEGEIIFEAADNSTTPAGGKIAEGKYSLRVTPGAKKVKVLASRPTSKPDPVMGSAARESALGAEYNTNSTLKADIKPGKQDGIDFAVKQLPK